MTYDVTEGGRIVQVTPQAQPALEAGAPIGQDLYDLAVAIAQRQKGEEAKLPFKQRVADVQEGLRKMNGPQLDVMRKNFAEPMPATSSQPTGGTRPGATAAGTEGRAEAPPDNYAGLTFKQIENGLFQITGLKSSLREAWPIIKTAWKQNAKPPAFICTPDEAGKLQVALEKAEIKFRLH